MTRRNGALWAGAILTMAAAIVFTPSVVAAQAAKTLAEVTLPPDAAKRTMVKAQINAATARAIVDAAVEAAQGGTATYSIFILAPNGDILQAHVMDGQVPIGIETALLKAKTVLYARSSSRTVAERFATVEGRVIRTDLGRDSGLAYYFVGGGLPIIVEDQLIGAIGIGGGNRDEEIAHAALTKVLGPQPPLPPPAKPAGGGGQGAPAGAPQAPQPPQAPRPPA
jgi:glc operon protein GlcG